jgi:hypothetical protein
LTPITKDEAKAALEAAAFTIPAGGLDTRNERCVAVCRWLTALDQIPRIDRQPTLETAFALARAALGPERRIVHSFQGTLGTDHDLERALELVDEATEVGWSEYPFLGHELRVVTARGAYMYDVRRPDRDA